MVRTKLLINTDEQTDKYENNENYNDITVPEFDPEQVEVVSSEF